MTQTGARTHTWGGDTVHRNTALGSEGRSEPAFVCGDVCVCGWVFWVKGIALNIISGRFQKRAD